jgi:hypothetical protein
MNGSTGYKGWDDRRLPVKLQPTWWAAWAFRLGVVLLVAIIVLCVAAAALFLLLGKYPEAEAEEDAALAEGTAPATP